ncbi:hypothetical protein BDB01DRAFT_713824 [Pilobolus umbonatus]|nr:hypothetical protein BDB01DRAFT_713824 [Pilobolus umbonatus]
MPIGLPNLITFRISGNLIESLPNKVHLWTQMRHLQLGSVYGGNRLEHLPENIALMPVLEDLDVSSNLLKSLPCNMEIKSLQLLNVSSNHLDFIPKSIARCINLRNLNISKNHLTSLPTDLIHLKKLELFDISENLLCILPAEILESMQSTTLLLRGNPLTRPGHCDLPSDQDAYSKIIRQMTQRGVPRSSPGLSHKLRTESHSQHYLTYNQCGPTDDVDESIDYELSFHAQQLNVDGSRPCEPDKLFAYDDLIGTAHSKVVNDNISNSQYIMMDSPQKKPLPNCTLLLHSLREIASRTVLSHPSIQFPLEILPPHLMEDLSDVTNYKACSYCRGPFINEWVTSVQVKGFGGHPAVVRRVRFCSTKCWYACIPKDNEQSKSVICVHRP